MDAIRSFNVAVEHGHWNSVVDLPLDHGDSIVFGLFIIRGIQRVIPKSGTIWGPFIGTPAVHVQVGLSICFRMVPRFFAGFYKVFGG